jgi:selT/selW/selH-like putative selenoprotein
MGFKAAMFGFYAGSMLSSRFANTGAFEVAFDGALLYSRLATGTFPAPAEIVYQLQEVLASAGQA